MCAVAVRTLHAFIMSMNMKIHTYTPTNIWLHFSGLAINKLLA